MNTIYIQNKAGFNDKIIFVVNGRKYQWMHNDQQVIEIPDGMRIVQIQVQSQRFRSPVYNFDLKDGQVFTAHCHPLIGVNDVNRKIFIFVYLFLIVLAMYTDYTKVMIALLLIAVILVVFFLAVGCDNFFVMKQQQ